MIFFKNSKKQYKNQKQLKELTAQVEQLTLDKQEMQKIIEDNKTAIEGKADNTNNYEAQLVSIKKEHSELLASIALEHETKMTALTNEFQSKIDALTASVETLTKEKEQVAIVTKTNINEQAATVLASLGVPEGTIKATIPTNESVTNQELLSQFMALKGQAANDFYGKHETQIKSAIMQKQ